MKIMLRRVFCSIFILFSIVSVISLLYNYGIIKEEMDKMDISSQPREMHQEMINLKENMSIDKCLRLNYYNGMLNMIYQELNILLISVFIGTVIGLFLSIKESKVAKYILFFLLGNILLNIIMGMVIQRIYLNNEIILTFFEAYLKGFVNTILIYSISYVIILAVGVLENKRKIEKQK